MDDQLQERRRNLMARPWAAAPPCSIWEITGTYPNGRGTFTACLAMVLPEAVTGTSEPVFKMLGPLGRGYEIVGQAQIESARPLLLVDRDDPSQPYWEADTAWLPGRRVEEMADELERLRREIQRVRTLCTDQTHLALTGGMVDADHVLAVIGR